MDQYYGSGLEQGKHPACHSITSGKWKKRGRQNGLLAHC